MLLHPTIAAREPVPGEEQGTHLEPCAFCATANGATALTCWRCGADLRHGRLDELVSKRRDASAAVGVADAPPTAMPPAGVPIPTLYPSFNAFDPNATVPMTIGVGLLQPSAPTVEPDSLVLDMSKLFGDLPEGGRQLTAPHAPPPEMEPGTSLVVAEAPEPFSRKQRSFIAAGLVALSTVAVIGGSELLDHYQTARVGAGWSTSARPDAQATQTTQSTPSPQATQAALPEDPAETLRRQPSQAGAADADAMPVAATGDSAAATLAAPAAAALATAVPAVATATAPTGSTSPGAADGPLTPDADPAPVADNPSATAGTAATSTAATGAATSTAATGAAATTAPVAAAAETPTVRRRTASRASTTRYAAARRDTAQSREPSTDRAEPAAPRPCTAGVAALGLCTP